MRSSKPRSRNKNHRNRPSGNIVNRVFDSSGPEGKVRGTPQQIIDKYNQLARDAHLSNDRVAVENFQQHAEHYLRLLSEAQREQDSRREDQERQNRERQADRDRDRSQRQEREVSNAGHQPQQQQQPSQQQQPQQQQQQQQQQAVSSTQPDLAEAPQPDVMEVSGGGDSGLVETPENAAPKPKPRKPRRKPEPKPEAAAEQPASENAVSDEAPKKPRRTRAPKPKATEPEAPAAEQNGDAPEAAE